MPHSIDWPHALDDIVMLSFAGPMRRQFTLRPCQSGRWRFLVWPAFPFDSHGVSIFETEFETATQLPELFEWAPPPGFEKVAKWAWSAICLAQNLPNTDLALERDRPSRECGKPIDIPLHERSSLVDQAMAFSQLQGQFELFDLKDKPHSFAMWSCHQPFEGAAGESARIVEGTHSILKSMPYP